MRTIGRFASLAVVLGVLLGAAQDGNWSAYGRDPGGERFSPLDGIRRDNVASLQVAWTFRTGDSYVPEEGRPTAFEATPLCRHHLPRISSEPSPDGEHDGACRNSHNQDRRFRSTEGAALKSNNVLPSECGVAARDNRIAVDPINHKRPLLPIWGLHDDGVARFQWPVDWLARSRRGLNPLHTRAAR
jgi:hypothetical protein